MLEIQMKWLRMLENFKDNTVLLKFKENALSVAKV
jgi:hypothetical protein